MRKLTTEEFIIKAKAVHGDNYDYSKTLYLDSVSKVEVNCHKHGAFYQLPHSHLRGSGCPSCANVKVVTTSEFISRARNVHGNLYDYSLSIVHGMKRRLKIICAIHGEFHQSPASHLSGSGCPSCSGNERKDTSNFIKKAIHLHGSKYDYSFVSYSWTHGKVIIICKKHGEFSQTAHNHLMGQGCPGCSQRGFSPHKEAFLYFLISSDGCNLKVGISNNIKRRINTLCRSTPFEFNLIAKVKTTGAEAMRLEKYYHRKYESAGLTGFDGATEWLKYSKPLMDEIMK